MSMPERIIRLYREGHDTSDGRRIVATTWTEPVLVSVGSLGGQPLGVVTRIGRDPDTGWVSGLLTIDINVTGLAAEAGFDGGEYSIAASSDGEDGVAVYAGARLRYILLGTNPTWEGMWL
jgi:hypothetical protein